MKRTLTNQLSDCVGQTAEIKGWVTTRRDHGKIIFIDLRDRAGLAQVVFLPNGETHKLAQGLRPNFVVSIQGLVKQRPNGMANPNIASGTIELQADNLEILSKAKTLPFEISETREVNEELRMKYRYLDLRSQRMRKNIIDRHKILQFIRSHLVQLDFIEIETPILTKSTPEGARDYIVPSRLQPCHFYALPQSPQQYKQLLMVAGFERYFQIPRCFRDEDTRGDRQPEFTQIDLEISFTSQQEIMDIIEAMYRQLVKKMYPNKKITLSPFPKISYDQAMARYQSDRPDLRKNKADPDELAFAWITDFPMFEKKADGSLSAAHHPFTLPYTDKLSENILAYQYDLVCNGFEIGGGSLRTTDMKLLTKVFEFLGHDKREIKSKFGHLIEAYEFGAPPHGGIALGFDRLITILNNESSIREVIAFPKTGDGRDLMMNSPSNVSETQLKELNIKCRDSR